MNKIILEILKKILGIETLKELTIKKAVGKFIWYLIPVAALLIFYTAFQEFALSADGKNILGNIVGKMPFVKAVNSIFKETFDYSEEIKEAVDKFSADSVLVSLCKVLFMVWITPVFDWFIDLAAKIFTAPGKETPSYGTLLGAVKFLLRFLEILIRIILTAVVFEPFKDALDAFDPTMATVLALILFVLLFLLVGFCRALVEDTPADLGIIRTYFIKILPKLLDVFVSNSLCLLLYLFWQLHPYGWQPAVTFIFLLIWFMGIRKWIENLFKKTAEALLKSGWTSSSVSVGQFVLWILCIFSTMILMYAMVLINLWDDSASRLFSLSSFPFVQAIVQNQSIRDMFLSPYSNFWSSFFVLTAVCIAVAFLVKKPLAGGISGVVFYTFIWGGVTLAAGILTNKFVLWILEKDEKLDTNRYNGKFGILFFAVVFFLLLYNYQLIIAAAVTAVLIICMLYGAVSAGISFAGFLDGLRTGQFWAAYAAVIVVALAVGALTYALRKKR